MSTTVTATGPGNVGPHAHALRARLAPVLADLTFPARRWQALAVADLYGCDVVTRGLVLRLPERTYVSFGDLVGVLGAVLAGHSPVVGPVTRTVVPPPPADRPSATAPRVPGARRR